MNTTHALRTPFLPLAAALSLAALAPRARADEGGEARLKEARARYAADLAQAAEQALSRKLVARALSVLGKALRADPRSPRLEELAKKIAAADAGPEKPADVEAVAKKAAAADKAHAKALVEVASALAKEKAAEARVVAVLEEAVALDPAQTKQLAKAGFAWTDEQGVVSEDALKHLKKGDARVEGEWVAAKQAEALDREHADLDKNPWKVASEHFAITSDAPYAAVQAALRECEKTHDFLAGLFGEKLGVLKEKVRVQLFRTHEEARARGKLGGATTANYSLDDRTVYAAFETSIKGTFASNLCHETTHAVLFLIRGRNELDSERWCDYWCIEGLAVYAEALAKDRRPLELDYDPASARRLAQFQDAFKKGSAPAFADFAGLDQQHFLSGDATAVVARYTCSAGWVHFFLNAGGGRYRTRFLDFALKVHEGIGSSAFKEAFGRTPQELGAEFQAYWKGR